MKSIELLKEIRIVLDNYWFSSVSTGDGYTEGYNNDDIIELCDKIDEHLKLAIFFEEGGD